MDFEGIEGQPKRAIRVLSIETKLVAQRIASMKVGDILTWNDLSDLLGIPAQTGHGYRAVQSGRNIAFRDHGIVLGIIIKTGYRRLSDSEIVESSNHISKKVRKISRKGMARLSKVEYEKLSHEEKSTHNGYLALFSLMTNISSVPSTKKIISNCVDTPLTLGQTMKLFTN